MSDTPTFIDRLQAVHEFPCVFTFKLVGANTRAFSDGIRERVLAVLPDARPILTKRESRKGTYQSVTLEVRVQHAETVPALYESLKGLEGLKVVL